MQVSFLGLTISSIYLLIHISVCTSYLPILIIQQMALWQFISVATVPRMRSDVCCLFLRVRHFLSTIIIELWSLSSVCCSNFGQTMESLISYGSDDDYDEPADTKAQVGVDIVCIRLRDRGG